LEPEGSGRLDHSERPNWAWRIPAFGRTLPTAHEQGLVDFDVVSWTAFFLPKGAPPEVVKKLNDATSRALDTPATKTRLHELGITAVAPEHRSPEYLAKFVVDEIARWAGPIKANGLQVD
jgi:tripartite-type tricarboxylate transporter receptor subunit TctC